MPKGRQHFLSMSPEGGETINNVIKRLKKTVEYCEYGVEEENQIIDRVLYFIRNKVLKRKLYREGNLSLTKLQEIANIFDEPEALLLSPAGTREHAHTVYAKRTILVVSALPKEHFKENGWKCDNLGHIAKRKQKIKESHMYVRNATRRVIFQYVATPDNRKVAPLSDSHTVSLRMKAGGVVVESRMFEILKNKTRKKIHAICSR